MAKTICEYDKCHKDIFYDLYSGRPKKYCNSTCRGAAWRQAHSRYLARTEAGESEVIYSIKKAEASWQRILARTDPITHRYRNSPETPTGRVVALEDG